MVIARRANLPKITSANLRRVTMWKVFSRANNDRQIVLNRTLNDLAINLRCELGPRCID